MGLADSIGSLGGSITSPAKLAFIGYVLLAYSGKVETSRWEFIVVALVFFALQIAHDDFARIWLNERARQLAVDSGRK